MAICIDLAVADPETILDVSKSGSLVVTDLLVELHTIHGCLSMNPRQLGRSPNLY